MFDSAPELLDKIRLGEDNALELKAVTLAGKKVTGPARESLADELAAMANTADGVCLLGVDDKSRQVDGIPVDKLDLVETFVRELCHDSVTPPLRVHILRLELPDALGELRAVLKIEVPRSLFVHRSPGGYFQRIGSSKREMPPELLARLFQQRSQARLIRFDEQAVPETRLVDLEPSLWGRLCDPTVEDPVRTLHKRKILTMDEGQERATVTGLLLCCTHPETWLPGASARAVRFRGVVQDSNNQVDAADITGPLDQQILALYAFARRNMQVSVQEGPPRAEVPQFSERALFEAIVNAVVHRDYSVHGSRIRLFLFDDRLELYSPGPLPNTLSVESIALRQSTRNEAVKSIMVKLPVGEAGQGSGRGFFMEAQGDGVPVILRETRRLAGGDPVWTVLDGSEVLLTIPSAADPSSR
ncbi:putative DNA binding domain-containing protein [Myxococcota bacterium]|nr:putative DNA binding domain-containing protein [Myxococcota bacterium]